MYGKNCILKDYFKIFLKAAQKREKEYEDSAI